MLRRMGLEMARGVILAYQMAVHVTSMDWDFPGSHDKWMR